MELRGQVRSQMEFGNEGTGTDSKPSPFKLGRKDCPGTIAVTSMIHPLFVIIYLLVLVGATFCIVAAHKSKGCSPKERLIANVAGWSLFAGCLLHIFIDTVTISDSRYMKCAHLSTSLMAFSLGAFVCLGILNHERSR